jgi:hypothetical protein
MRQLCLVDTCADQDSVTTFTVVLDISDREKGALAGEREGKCCPLCTYRVDGKLKSELNCTGIELFS